MSTTTDSIYDKAAKAAKAARNLQRKMQATSANASWAQYSYESTQQVHALAVAASAAEAKCGIACDNDDIAGAQSAADEAVALLKQARAAARSGKPLDDQPEE